MAITAGVVRGVKHAHIVGDVLPLTYQASIRQAAMINAAADEGRWLPVSQARGRIHAGLVRRLSAPSP